MKDNILLKTAAALLLGVPLLTLTAETAEEGKAAGAGSTAATAATATAADSAAAKTKETPTEAAKSPDAELLAFVAENSSGLISASLAGNSAFMNEFDTKLTETITRLGADAKIEALHKNPFGTVVKIEKFIKDDVETPAGVRALIYKKEIAPGTVTTLELFPTGMIINDNGENIVIYAPDSLSAYKACCASLSSQLQQTVYIRQLQQTAANAAQAAEAARQEAEAARQTALQMQQQTLLAQQQAAQAQQQALAAQQQAMYNDDDEWDNGWYGNGGWYGGGIIIYNPSYPPFPPPPCPPPKPEPTPPPKPEPKPDNWTQRFINSTKTAPRGPNIGNTPGPSQMYPTLGRH